MDWDEIDGRQTYVMERPQYNSVNERSGPALPQADLHSSGGRCEKAYQIHEFFSFFFQKFKLLRHIYALISWENGMASLNFGLLLYFDGKTLNISVCRLNL